ncbi:hypothetical protein HLH26_18185 [Gluconacetobacter sp. 1b LMG 1731]|uniref:Uncharacterized protein n=1 Tax=Gluconacetobacter dulcium TaxID=2729096 RepID=A0A7W4NU61_9PROT|nr:hypothetical protein [Gluconacetobacter dulcium]MBB2166421.1 hypothetical protein [Gluconacetobacter dulcium]
MPVNFHPPSSRTILNPADASAGFDLGGLQERLQDALGIRGDLLTPATSNPPLRTRILC